MLASVCNVSRGFTILSHPSHHLLPKSFSSYLFIMPHAISPERQALQTNVQFFVNDGALASDQIAPLKSTTLDTPIEEIRRRYRDDGYVFLKGLLPRADVLKARREYFELLSPSGVLAPDTEPVDGIFDSLKDKLDFPGIGVSNKESNGGRPIGPNPDIASKFVDLALQAHTEPWYKDEFCKHPALHNFIAEMTGWKHNTLGIQRTLLRNNTPGNKAIGVHYDQIFLRYGEDTSVTAWGADGRYCYRRRWADLPRERP